MCVALLRIAHIVVNAFEFGEKGHGQVAILQDDPGAILESFVDHAHGDGSLALAERYALY